MKRLAYAYYCGVYFASWLVFGVVGLGLNIACAALLPLPRTDALQRSARRSIRLLFDFWTRWLHATGVVQLRWVGFPASLPSNTIYVANHPTLADATFVLSRLPDAFCIFKPSLMRNPCVAPAAILGGYVSGGRHVDTIREAAKRVSDGQSLLIFPEGTRTAYGTAFGRVRPGFALIAQRSKAPVQSIVIHSPPGLVSRGRPWWTPPRILPAIVEIRLGEKWTFDPGSKSIELAARVQSYFQSQLSESAT